MKSIELSYDELGHIQNDIIAYKNDLLEKVVGTCDITEKEISNLPQEMTDDLILYGYFTRMRLLEKLENFSKMEKEEPKS